MIAAIIQIATNDVFLSPLRHDKEGHNREPLDELISTHSWLRRKAKSHRRKAASAAMQRADRQPQAEPSSSTLRPWPPKICRAI